LISQKVKEGLVFFVREKILSLSFLFDVFDPRRGRNWRTV
jgi:hypothetical protein